MSSLTTSIPPKLVHPVCIMDRPPHASIIDGRVIRPENRFVSKFSGKSALHMIRISFPKNLRWKTIRKRSLTAEAVGDVKEK